MGKVNRQPSQLQRVVGRHGVTALASVFPGQRIYVPWSNPEAVARFLENFTPLIGPANAASLIDEFGGGRIAVPSNLLPQRERLDLELVAELTAIKKLTARQIAQILRCDPRSVHAARARARATGLLKFPKRRRKGKR